MHQDVMQIVFGLTRKQMEDLLAAEAQSKQNRATERDEDARR